MKAFLFDLDETLTDAQRGIEAALQAVAERLIVFLRQRGDSVKRERVLSELWKVEIERSVQRSYDRDEWWLELLSRLNLPPLRSEQLKELTDLYWSTFSKHNLPFPDVEPTLQKLRDMGLKLGLVTDTDGTPGLKRNRMSNMPLLKYFHVVVVAGEDTPLPKPNPKPFLLAAEKLNVEPAECVMVGDKPYTDIRGAKAAGMAAVRIFRRRWHDEEPANFTINSISQLLDLLPKLR